MIIASHQRKNNIAEYLLYMWQIEDLIRANGLDMERINENVVSKFAGLSDKERKEISDWYESLIDMMRREGVTEKGHLQINRNVLSDLVALHQTLLADSRFPEYSARFYKALPYIVELRAKSGDAPAGEIETCFNALYGLLMLRLQKKELTKDTAEAIKAISAFIAELARDYHLDEADKLFPPDDSLKQ